MSYNTILATAPLTTQNYHLKMIGTTIGNSLIWDNGTNVGIGNTNTSYTLDVSGTGRFTGALSGTSGSAFIGSGNGLKIGYDNVGGGLFFADGNNASSYKNWRIATSYVTGGDITFTPSTTNGGTTFSTPSLTILSTGAATFSSSVTAGGAITTNSGGVIIGTGSGANWQVYKDPSTSFLGMYLSGASPFMVINSAGNVGIGTSTPNRRLVVPSDGTNWISGVFGGTGGTDVVVIGNLSGASIGGHNSTLTGWAALDINPDGGLIRLGKNSTNNVLIGTTTDDTVNKLQVTGSGVFTSTLKSTAFKPASTNSMTIPLNITNYQIFSYAFIGILVVRDNSFGGSGAFLMDPNNGTLLISSNLPYVLTFTYVGPGWNVQKSAGGATTISFNALSGGL